VRLSRIVFCPIAPLVPFRLSAPLAGTQPERRLAVRVVNAAARLQFSKPNYQTEMRNAAAGQRFRMALIKLTGAF
jgi:hypothetical protein